MRTVLLLVLLVPAGVAFMVWNWRWRMKRLRRQQAYLKSPHWAVIQDHGFRGNPVSRSLSGTALSGIGSLLLIAGLCLIFVEGQPLAAWSMTLVGVICIAVFTQRRDRWAQSVLDAQDQPHIGDDS